MWRYIWGVSYWIFPKSYGVEGQFNFIQPNLESIHFIPYNFGTLGARRFLLRKWLQYPGLERTFRAISWLVGNVTRQGCLLAETSCGQLGNLHSVIQSIFYFLFPSFRKCIPAHHLMLRILRRVRLRICEIATGSGIWKIWWIFPTALFLHMPPRLAVHTLLGTSKLRPERGVKIS